MKRIKIAVFILFSIMTLSMGFMSVQPALNQSEYFFEVTLLCPTNNSRRVQFAQLIALELPKIGIDANLVLVGWDIFLSRFFGSLTHEGYAKKGFDVGFVAYSTGPGSNPGIGLFPYFHSSHIDPPWGGNNFPVENSILDALLELMRNATYFELDNSNQYLAHALDILVWDIHPITSILHEERVFYMRDNVRGFDPSHYPYLPIEKVFFPDGHSFGHGQANEFIMGGYSYPSDFNPHISGMNPYWAKISETMVYTSVFTRLLSQDAAGNLVPETASELPYPVAAVNNHDGEMSSTDPKAATVWEINLRDDVFWHEGYGYTMDVPTEREILHVTAENIAWYFRILIDDEGPYILGRGTDFQRVFGTDPEKAFVVKNETCLQFHLANTSPFQFYIFGLEILPQHILDPNFNGGFGVGVRADGTNTPSYDDWSSDDFNKGIKTTGDTDHPATIGCGPYLLYPGKDTAQQNIELTTNPYYFKDNDTTYWKDLVVNRPDKYIYASIPRYDDVKIALESGGIDLMDAFYQVDYYKYYPLMRNKPGIAHLKKWDYSWQTFSYNILNGANGKLANKWVRLAMSHMIPRQRIVDNLFNKLGIPTFVPFIAPDFYPEDLDPIVYNYSRALEYMEKAGYNTDMIPQASPINFEIIAWVMAFGGLASVTIILRRRRPKKSP